jgi:class 3 adenylate cyclase/DNA-binding beta-propeller fold protein YncE
VPSLPRGTVTFLFSDIEGSTQLQRRLDDRYQEVVEEHRRLLEVAIETHGGTVVDRQTESFFCAFSRASNAVQAAVSAQRALAERAWPDGVEVRVRMGIHAGEPEVAGDRYIGLAVSRAARICAAGHGGQVLLSSSARALLADDQRAGLRELGSYRLKDFPAPEPISQLLIDGLPYEFPPLRTEARPARRKRLGLAAAALVAAGGIAAVLVLTLGGGSGGLKTVGPTSVGVIDPTTNRLAAEVPLGFTSSLIAAGEGSVWVADPQGSTLTKIDPKTRKITTTGIGAGTIPTGIAAGEGAVWLGVVSTGGRRLSVLELGPDLGNLRQEIVLERGAFDPARNPVMVAVGQGAVWALEQGQGKVVRIDPKTGAVSRSAEGISALSIAVGLGAVWVGGRIGVTRIDPGTVSVLGSIPVGGLLESQTMSLAVGTGGVWFAGTAQPKVFRIAAGPSAAVTGSFPVGRGPSGVAVGAGAVWVANSRDGTVSRVDATSGKVETIRLGASPGGIVAAFGSVWTSPGQPAG